MGPGMGLPLSITHAHIYIHSQSFTHNGYIPVADEQQSSGVSDLMGSILDTHPSFDVLDLHSILSLQLFEGTLGARLTKINGLVCTVNQQTNIMILSVNSMNTHGTGDKS